MTAEFFFAFPDGVERPAGRGRIGLGRGKEAVYLCLVRFRQERGRMPSYREMGEMLCLKSTAYLLRCVEGLVKKGFVSRSEKGEITLVEPLTALWKEGFYPPGRDLTETVRGVVEVVPFLGLREVSGHVRIAVLLHKDPLPMGEALRLAKELWKPAHEAFMEMERLEKMERGSGRRGRGWGRRFG